MFSAKMDQHISRGLDGPTMAVSAKVEITTAIVTETAVPNHNPENVSQTQNLVRFVITAKRRTTSNQTVLNVKEATPQYNK